MFWYGNRNGHRTENFCSSACFAGAHCTAPSCYTVCEKEKTVNRSVNRRIALVLPSELKNKQQPLAIKDNLICT